MVHNDDAYAAMLLTMALSPNKEEYARPLATQEFRRFEAMVRACGFGGIGRLMDLDISALMIYLNLGEAEAMRVYTLLHRGMQLTYALNGYSAEGIDVTTQYDDDYPRRLERKLKDAAPPFLYRCGDASLLDRPAIALTGISGVRTLPEAYANLETLVTGAAELGYAVITGGEPGVSRQAAGLVAEKGGALIEILGGGMRERLGDDAVALLVAQGRALVLSPEHPDALFTVSHAIARNKLLFALADAAFIFNTDGRRGEGEALQSRVCDWVYAWTGCEDNRPLLARGAKPFDALTGGALKEMSRHWSTSSAQQMNIFDMLSDV